MIKLPRDIWHGCWASSHTGPVISWRVSRMRQLDIFERFRPDSRLTVSIMDWRTRRSRVRTINRPLYFRKDPDGLTLLDRSRQPITLGCKTMQP